MKGARKRKLEAVDEKQKVADAVARARKAS
jgi:hypothetical protein